MNAFGNKNQRIYITKSAKVNVTFDLNLFIYPSVYLSTPSVKMCKDSLTWKWKDYNGVKVLQYLIIMKLRDT